MFGSMLVTSFVLFLASSKAIMRSRYLRVLTDLLREEKRGVTSIVVDLVSLSLWTKGAKAVLITQKSAKDADDRVTMGDLGDIVDLFCRVLYPVRHH